MPAIAGVFAVVQDLACRQAFSNIIGGIFIVIFKPFPNFTRDLQFQRIIMKMLWSIRSSGITDEDKEKVILK